jgi:phospholipase C
MQAFLGLLSQFIALQGTPMKIAAALPAVALAAMAAVAPAQAAPAGLNQIDHIVVIYLENRSFDNLYALFPGANGLTGKHTTWAPQVDKDGKPYVALPAIDDPRFPAALPNAPFRIEQYVPQEEPTIDLVHRFYQNQAQINGGKNDKYAAVSDAGGMVMGFYDSRDTKLWNYARRYTLADNFFQGAFGGSMLNHLWLACACTPKFDAAPDSIRAKLDANGALVKDGAVSPDGYVINTIYTTSQPHPASATDTTKLLPPVTLPTIGDRLSEKNVSWAWYSGGWNDALAGKPDETFQFHHQPLAYFASFADGTPGRAQHLKDEEDLYAAIAKGNLPTVSFYKPIGAENQHPGYSNITNADNRAADVIDKLQASPMWKSTAVIVTYDENGGFWDHVAPPKADRWGPGPRVPTLVISPLAKKGFVDHTAYDTTSILKLIETRFGLAPLGERDAKAADMTHAFTFGK